ncbi:FtsX-like permease family protein [Rhizobium sp. CFBP 8762]|uniref:FtsX-like permease family protein n=1 Tax=Rhizobium sp. CFBP 8762 TaxID=2775279 RepID=UPI00177F0FCE|nr:FtsX-like permease family protein [Rhizobium sp. CFBP 8762]MBD8554175.1 FtsX-like permease family protein [Rhizobium sp. CFBP 8762]
MIRFIVADLKRLWAGSLVIVLLVACAAALGIAVTLQERALRLGSARAADAFDLVVAAPGSETQIVLASVFLQPSALPLVSGSVLHTLSQDPRVAWAAPVGFGDFYGQIPIVGTTSDLVLQGGKKTLTDGRMFSKRTEAVIGAKVEMALGDIVTPMHGLAHEGGHVHADATYTVVGRAAETGSPWDKAILVPIEGVWHVHGMEGAHGLNLDPHHGEQNETVSIGEPWTADTPGVPAIIVKPKSIGDAYRLRQEYRTASTTAIFPAEVLTRLYATLGDARALLSAVAIGSQILVGAAIALVAVIHVGQKRSQIAALRAFGAPRTSLFIIVWSQLLILTTLGAALGMGLGYAIARLISHLLKAESGVTMPVAFIGSDMRMVIGLIVAASLLALGPAALACRQSVAGALRR